MHCSFALSRCRMQWFCAPVHRMLFWIIGTGATRPAIAMLCRKRCASDGEAMV